MTLPIKVILDVDTGTDDAIALMLAVRHPYLDLLAATSVNGNNPVAACTDNTLRVLDLLGADVPVYEGASTALLRDDFPIPRKILHASGSMHGRQLPIPEPRSSKQDQGAIEFLIDTFMSTTDEITLVPLGPLTNLALAIHLEPRIVDRIARVVLMGGAHDAGNTTPSAEFNIWADPESARVVFRAGLADLHVIPLDATHRALMTAADCHRLRAAGTPASLVAATIIEGRIAAYESLQPLAAEGSAPVHDALCVAYLVDATLVSGRRVHVDIETTGALTIGRTVIDIHGHFGQAPNAFVGFDADARRFVDLLVGVLGLA